jgi:hypothetical protein
MPILHPVGLYPSPGVQFSVAYGSQSAIYLGEACLWAAWLERTRREICRRGAAWGWFGSHRSEVSIASRRGTAAAPPAANRLSDAI